MKRILVLVMMVIMQLSYAADDTSVLYSTKHIKITKHLPTGEVHIAVNLYLAGLSNNYEFKQMLQEMNINSSEYFYEATYIMEECRGDEIRMLLTCNSTNKRMILKDRQGQKFEIIVRGKASSYLQIDRTERMCDDQTKAKTTFDLLYSGDYITINGVSIREKNDGSRLKREKLSENFLNSIGNFLKSYPLDTLCF